MKLLVFIFIFQIVLGCGVKGDPLPPLKPAQIGRGEPTYKKATQEVPLPKSPYYAPSLNEQDEDEAEENEDYEEY